MRPTTPRIVVGSFLGALCIHVAMVACGGGGGDPRPAGDAGGLSDAVADVRDAIADAMKDVVNEVLDAETPDAHAGGDGGTDAGADGGLPSCACPPPAQPEYTFSGGAVTRSGMAPQEPQADFSSATVAASTPTQEGGALAVSITAGSSYPLADGSLVSISCVFTVRADRTIIPRMAGGMPFDASCYVLYRSRPGPTGSDVTGSNGGGVGTPNTNGVRVMELADGRAVVVLPSFAFPIRRSEGGTQVEIGTVNTAPITVRAVVPGAQWLTPPRAYRP